MHRALINLIFLYAPAVISLRELNLIERVPDVRESGKFLLVESGIQLKESGIPLTIKIQNPLSTNKVCNPVSVEFEIQNCLDLNSLSRGDE